MTKPDGKKEDRVMKNADFRLTVLGARGSMAISRPGYSLFGGATSCYMVEAGEHTLFLDGGSGLLDAPVRFPHPPVILLTHLHLDHILGLGMYPRFLRRGESTEIYLPARDGTDPLQQMDTVYSPPYWPVSFKQMTGDVRVKAYSGPLRVGDIQIDSMPGNHPGGCLVFRLVFQGKSILYATDYEYEERSFEGLTAFCRSADLLMYDAQYTPEEYEFRRGFGHSTAEMGLELMQRSGAKRLLFIHHDPWCTDEMLLEREKQIIGANASYARAGEVITL